MAMAKTLRLGLSLGHGFSDKLRSQFLPRAILLPLQLHTNAEKVTDLRWKNKAQALEEDIKSSKRAQVEIAKQLFVHLSASKISRGLIEEKDEYLQKLQTRRIETRSERSHLRSIIKVIAKEYPEELERFLETVANRNEKIENYLTELTTTGTKSFVVDLYKDGLGKLINKTVDHRLQGNDVDIYELESFVKQIEDVRDEEGHDPSGDGGSLECFMKQLVKRMDRLF